MVHVLFRSKKVLRGRDDVGTWQCVIIAGTEGLLNTGLDYSRTSIIRHGNSLKRIDSIIRLARYTVLDYPDTFVPEPCRITDRIIIIPDNRIG